MTEPEILYENNDYLICVKPRDLVSEQTPDGTGLADRLAARNGGYIGVIHRLDRGVGGLMVYAKTPRAAAFLSSAVQEHRLGKEYAALVSGVPAPETGEWRDLLYFDRSKNKVYPVRRMRNGVKEAILTYRVESTSEMPGIGTVSEVSVLPLTGRTHQIRVQFASRGYPLVGDRRYGGKAAGSVHLWCRRLVIPDGNGKDAKFFESEPDWQKRLL